MDLALDRFRRITLERIRHRLGIRVGAGLLRSMRVDATMDHISRELVVRVEAEMVGREVGRVYVERRPMGREVVSAEHVPASWWDAFQEEVVIPRLLAFDYWARSDARWNEACPWWRKADPIARILGRLTVRHRRIEVRVREFFTGRVDETHVCPHLDVATGHDRRCVEFLSPAPDGAAEDRRRHLFRAAARYAAEAVSAADRQPWLGMSYGNDDPDRFLWAMESLRETLREIDRT